MILMETRKKILLVDDELDTVTLLGNILKRADFDVILTTKGKEAIELARSSKPDLIILDVVMPDILGGEVANILHKDSSTSSIPVILLSGLNTKEDEEIIKKKTGSYKILAKPITAEELLEAVNRTLSLD